MAGIREKLAHSIPWIEPLLDYFDWRKRVVSIVVGTALTVWSFLKDLPWPVILSIALITTVGTAYATVFPAFVKLINFGVNPRPNYAIWRHKKQFTLLQAAFLLADRQPVFDLTLVKGDAAAWYEVLREALITNELPHVPTNDRHSVGLDGSFVPQPQTPIEASALKEFCLKKGRRPEFLN